MIHLGDITKITGAEIEPVWVVTGGSPCQDLSIAGKRAGLAGARSGLFMEQVRIVKEMRAEDKRNGRTGDMVRPRYLVWENVVGAFSSNRGKDFAAVLEEIARIAEPGFSLSGLPDKQKWTKAGAIDGDGWSIAWRTHDAKDWGKTIRDSRTGNVIRLGTPQRRRRISVVADFGGESAAQIQFDRESVSGHPAESGAAGERLAEAAESCFNPAVGDCLTAWDCQSKRIFDTNGKSPTLQGGVGGGVNNPAIFCMATLAAAPSGANRTPAVVAMDMSHACDVIRECGEQVPALQARMGTGGNQVPLTYQMNGFGDYRAAEVASSCKQRDFKDSTDLAITHMVVRRLTPMECERLQGFPDHWTDIGEWTDEKGKKHKDADSPRYKALGNSIALPFWDWMLRRMARYLPEGATLGSLFDGIGGFPLIWERIHGKGAARWASEIEPFPIAVTKKHFSEEE
jgi:DNA (cytosine-5)-methyltransferase 1